MALGIDPNNPLALISLGQALCELADPELLKEAEAVSRRAVALAPRSPQAINNLGKVLRLQGRLDEAAACEQRLSAPDSRGLIARQDKGPSSRQQPSDPESARGHQRRGLTFLEESQLDKAEAAFREALRLDPTLAISWTSLARIQAERGDFEQSCQSARSALAVSPKLVEAYWRLAITLKGRLPDHEFQAMEELLGDDSLSNDARSMLKFGLAAVLDGRGLYSQAASHLETANALESAEKAARGLFYDPDLHSEFIAQMIAAFNADLFNRGRGWVEPDPRPVFVVGFPRSGTTLVEQILASHPKIHGAGELYDVHRIFDMLPQLVGQPALRSLRCLENPRSGFGESGSPDLSRVARCAGAPRGRPRRRQDARQRPAAWPDRPALARRSGDRLWTRPARYRGLLLASGLQDQPLEQRLGTHRPAVRRSSTDRRPLEADQTARMARRSLRRAGRRPGGTRTPAD